MNKFFASIVAVAMTVSISAHIHAQDATSKPIVTELTNKLKSAKSIKANFVTLYNNAKGDTKSTMKGSFITKENKYVINMNTHKVYNNGVDVYTYLVNAKEVQVSKYVANNDIISPASLFSGNFVKDFTYKYLGEKSIGGRKVHQIEFKPKVANSSYTRLELFIDVATSEISGGNVYEKNGNFYSISIAGLNMKSNVPDSEFTLDIKKLQGVEVIYLK